MWQLQLPDIDVDSHKTCHSRVVLNPHSQQGEKKESVSEFIKSRSQSCHVYEYDGDLEVNSDGEKY